MKSNALVGRIRGAALFAAAALTLAAGLAVAQDPPQPGAAAEPPALPVPPAPEVTGDAWLLMDFASGQVLAGENIHKRHEPASLTKVMTSYVVAAEMKAGRIAPDDEVLMSEHAWRTGGAGTDGSYSGFPVNETAPLERMEKGMVIQSGNDAAIALAEHIAGTVEAFASLMNAYAQRIGMENSHFTNPHGLPDANHYSTAYDLALLGRAMIRDFPEHYAYNKIKEFTVGEITQRNRNLLLWRDSSVDGIKTGHTSGAGYCLMTSAQRGDQRLITVVLGSTGEKQRADDSQALLEWGFRFFETHELYAAGKPITRQKVWKGDADEVVLGLAQPLRVTTRRGKYDQLEPSMQLPRNIIAPIKKGQELGTVKVTLDGEVVAERPLVALEAVGEGGFFSRLWDSFWLWWESI
ncbi:MAG TPA: D-alanyl-D-alanine carboxypeptidase family protein [Xanthomonadaceae bacterium]|nr:D-alanyl-D-alanine carboxypeptidase family protein [Xanthomonadaceae bacterium]